MIKHENLSPMRRLIGRSVLFAMIASAGLVSVRAFAEEGAAKNGISSGAPLTFPGITIDLKRRLVDLEATVCLDRGPLEVIACTKGTKEHESIVSVKCKPKQVHLGLLLIGAKNGKPAMRRRLDNDGSDARWVDLPPSGDPIVVSLVFKDDAGKRIERPIGDFVTRNTDAATTKAGTERANVDDAESDGERFPDAFLFAGSHLIQNNGKTHYLADLQGNVISVSTFGDEVLCLPGSHSKDNGALQWQANPETLPKVGTRVTLRLRPQEAREGEMD